MRPVFAILLPVCLLAQSPPPPDKTALLDAGRQFTAALKLDRDEDNALFDATGFDRAAALLNAVMVDGARKDATRDDWTALHRAIAGLIELHVHHGDLLKASVYASFQDVFYCDFENDYESALAAARLSLELMERSGETATAFINHRAVAVDLTRLGRNEEALGEYRRAHELVSNPTDGHAADIWRHMVLAEIALGHTGEAHEDAQRFVAFSNTAPSRFRAMALLTRSDVQAADGKYTDAVETVKQARVLVADPKEREEFNVEAGVQLMTFVLTAMHTLSYDDSLKLARSMDEEFPGMLFPIAPFAEKAIQVRRRLAGDFDGVLRDDNARLERARAAGDVYGQIETLRSISVTYSAMHAKAQQIQLLEQALALEEPLLPASGIPADYPSAYSFCTTLLSLGSAYADSSEIAKARRAFDRVTKAIEPITAAALRQKLDSLYDEAMLGKARVAGLDDDPDTARDLLDAALKKHPKDAWALLQYARLERDLKEHLDKAAQLYDSAVEAFRANREDHNEVAFRLEFAKFLATEAAGKVPDALAHAGDQVQTVEARVQSTNVADAQWRVHFVLGILAEARPDNAGAIAEYRKAVARLDQIRAGLSEEDQRQSFMDNDSAQELYQRLVALLTATGQHADAWQFLERGKARSFLEMLGGRRFTADSQDPANVQQLRAIEKQIADLRVDLTPQNETMLRAAGREPAQIQARLRELESQFTLAREQASLGSTRAGQTLALQQIAIERVRKLLPARSALIEYALLHDQLTAFVVTPSGFVQRTWPVASADLRRQVLRLRVMLANPNSGGEVDAMLAGVAKLVIAPLWDDLPKDADRLLIVPAGHLYYLPFQVLPLPDGRRMIDAYAIGYLPSASTLEFLQDDAKPAAGDLFLGALGAVSVEGMAPLPGTLRETDAIATVYPESHRASERAFTHDAARDALLRYSKIHFATHGLLDEEAPLFSALLTDPAPGQPLRLSLYEVMDLKLKARLVVLSACETGLGRLLGGDEVAGLTRTFLLAGAGTVVSSLWKVSDDSTALLMEGFHRRLRANMEPARAMREAALDVREKYPHPFFWAPFIVTGAR
jgi:CHAT domain-containing protein